MRNANNGETWNCCNLMRLVDQKPDNQLKWPYLNLLSCLFCMQLIIILSYNYYKNAQLHLYTNMHLPIPCLGQQSSERLIFHFQDNGLQSCSVLFSILLLETVLIVCLCQVLRASCISRSVSGKGISKMVEFLTTKQR